MIIERTTPYDNNRVKTLFNNLYPAAYNEYWFKEEYNPYENYYVKNESDIVAFMAAKKHSMMLKGKKLRFTYLSHNYLSVNERDKDTYSNMLEEVLKETSYQDLIVLAKPDDKRLYTKMGFEPIYERFKYKITCDQIDKYSANGIVSEVSEDDMYEVYQEYVSHFDGYMYRNKEYFRKMIEHYSDNNHKIILYRNSKGQPLGYAVFNYFGYPITINEIVYLNSAALLKMLSYIFKYKDTVIFSLTSAEKIIKIIPTAVYSKDDVVWAKVTDYDLFNRLYGTNISSLMQLKGLCKPFFINEDY